MSLAVSSGGLFVQLRNNCRFSNDSGRMGAVPGTYELDTGGLPYLVVYGLSDTQIIVYGVFHGAESR